MGRVKKKEGDRERGKEGRLGREGRQKSGQWTDVGYESGSELCPHTLTVIFSFYLTVL